MLLTADSIPARNPQGHIRRRAGQPPRRSNAPRRKNHVTRRIAKADRPVVDCPTGPVHPDPRVGHCRAPSAIRLGRPGHPKHVQAIRFPTHRLGRVGVPVAVPGHPAATLSHHERLRARPSVWTEWGCLSAKCLMLALCSTSMLPALNACQALSSVRAKKSEVDVLHSGQRWLCVTNGPLCRCTSCQV